MIKDIKNFPLVIAFSALIVGGTVFDMVSPDEAFSDTENRSLKQSPILSVSAILDNSFSLDYEEYINDQFIMRDEWISLKSVSESALLKVENNDIIFGEDGYMFAKLASVDEERFNRNINSIKTFLNMYSDNSSFVIVPDSVNIMTNKYTLPQVNVDEIEIIENLYENFEGINTINIHNALSEHKDEYIYYMTDHHWTTLGAYYAYEEIAKGLGVSPVDIASLENSATEGFYGTHYSKSKKFDAKSDTLTIYEDNSSSMTIDTIPKDGLNDLEKLELRDKYAVYLYGNNGFTSITTEPSEDKKDSILIIKDSFSNSLIPFLTYNYNQIDVVDLRHYRPKLSEHLQSNEYDDILVMYNFSNINSDVNIPLINY